MSNSNQVKFYWLLQLHITKKIPEFTPEKKYNLLFIVFQCSVRII